MFMKSKFPISEDNLIFKEIWVGGLSKEDLLQNLKNNNIGINEFALQIINHKAFTISSTRNKLQTVEISIVDSGFSNGATNEEVYQKAKEFGLKCCPPELGLHMRLQYIDFDQSIDPPTGNWQNIAMEKLSEDPSFPNGFYLRRREDGFWIRGYRASSEYLWGPDDRFIFLV